MVNPDASDHKEALRGARDTLGIGHNNQQDKLGPHQKSIMKIKFIEKQQISYRGPATVSSKIISILNCFYGYRGGTTV